MSSPLLGTIICIMYLDDAGFEEVKKNSKSKTHIPRVFPRRHWSVVLNYLI